MTFQQFGNYKLNRWIFRVTISYNFINPLIYGDQDGTR